MIPSKLVKPPRVAASPVHLECRYHCMLALPGRNLEQSHYVVVGQVIGVYIKDEAITPEGRIDVLKLRPLARLGYHDYTSVESCFTMLPIGPHAEIRQAGLAGKPLSSPSKTE
jgi:flavin reductase (DIM6/NTAB) family NADH-FMN oxidoreductase RutF